jgi:hypothetical protein
LVNFKFGKQTLFFQAKKEAESLRIELDRTKTELSRLNDEVRANADATLQRKALQSQLTRYPQLIEENDKLRRENQLLIETAENSQVLKEQVESLQQDLSKARYEAAQVIIDMYYCWSF